MDAGRDPIVEWKILEKDVPSFNPVNKMCRLCLRGKYKTILKPELATLNSRQEIFGSCEHKHAKFIGKPPDRK